MAKYYHIAFNFEGHPPKDKELNPVFDKGLDWVQYAPNCYIVWTSSDAEKWYRRLKPKVYENASIFICEIDPRDRSGFLPKRVWTWLDKDRTEDK